MAASPAPRTQRSSCWRPTGETRPPSTHLPPTFLDACPSLRSLVDEGELRRRVNPERICGLINAFAFDARAMAMGMNNLNLLTYTGPERFTMATELLPLHMDKVAWAAEVIEFMVNTAPWRISDTFISSVRNKSTVMQVRVHT